MGSIGGGIWHYFKGIRNAPKGERLRGGITSVKARAPIVGGEYHPLDIPTHRGSPAADSSSLTTQPHAPLSSRCLCRVGALLCEL
jgi:hypothetical protein